MWVTDNYGEIGVRAEFVKAAIDTTSHYTVPLEELVYIPPTMAPPNVSALPDYLEHPAEAVQYYRSRNIQRVVAEKKHMGSRAIVLLFRSEQAAGAVYRSSAAWQYLYTHWTCLFPATARARSVWEQLRSDLEQAGYFDRYHTDMVLLDAEIVPWNLKARELIASQYAHVAEAALHDRQIILDTLQIAGAQGRPVEEWINDMDRAAESCACVCRSLSGVIAGYTDGMEGIRIAPFHIFGASKQLLHRSRAHLGTWSTQRSLPLARSC